MRFKVTAVNRQDVETQVVAQGQGKAGDADCPFSMNAANSIFSIWLKPDVAKDIKDGDEFELTKAEK